jgi:ribosomal protein S18 acetylase RimI-like enzyme
MFIALDGDKIIGMICERGNGSISMLYVHKNYQRQGIGAALMNLMMDFFRKTSITTATLFAAPYAVPFYHAYGFTETGPEQNNDGFIFTPMAYDIG